MLIHKPCGVGLAQELSHLDGLRLAIFLRSQQSHVRVSHGAAYGSTPAEIWQNKAENPACALLA